MNVQQRIDLLVQLGQHLLSDDEQLATAKRKAQQENQWFTPDFINLSIHNIAHHFLAANKLATWVQQYALSTPLPQPKTVGLVMAGNIPLVGFHDLLCGFLSGHDLRIKPGSKDSALIKHIVQYLYKQEVTVQNQISFAEQLKDCDAYIATGSNNSSRYFEHYFAKYPHIIRRNRTSVAILSGQETKEELVQLADDVFLYYGLGCRNVTKIFVPEQYDFQPLLEAFRKYQYLSESPKYKNNLDYQLTLLILNNQQYMYNECILLSKNESPFSAISHLHYDFYTDKQQLTNQLKGNEDIQAIVGAGFLPFGQAQCPSLTDYADGVDTMAFLKAL
jgi:hypothetical protein